MAWRLLGLMVPASAVTGMKDIWTYDGRKEQKELTLTNGIWAEEHSISARGRQHVLVIIWDGVWVHGLTRYSLST